MSLRKDLLDASHEFKTPLAGVKTNIEVLNANEKEGRKSKSNI